MYNYDGSFGFGHMGNFGFFGIGHILLYALIIFLVIYFINNFSNKNKKNYESALEILKKRYAKGEIDKKEFEEKKKDLM